MYELVDFYGSQGKGLADVFRICRNIVDVSDFMPELRYILPAMWFARIPRRIMRRIKPLKRLYHRMKYGEKV